jgi:predicted dehydrogenase
VQTLPSLTKTDYGIGIVGVGGVAAWGNLPAYQRYGFRVVAAAVPRPEAREAVRRSFGIPQVYGTYQELLADPAVEIVDVTVHHLAEKQRLNSDGSDYVRLDIVRDAVAAGKKGVLMHKPMADTPERARLMVDAVRGSKTRLAVNQNGRWGPGHFVAKQLIELGYVGDVEAIAIENLFPLPLAGLHMAMTVHHYDTVRYWMGREPTRIYASMDPDKPLSAAMAILDFPGGARASIWDLLGGRLGMGSPTSDQGEHFRIEGTRGTIKGTHRWGPMMPPDAVEYYSELGPNAWVKPVLDETFPEAGFRGAMGDLMQAITDDREPACSGEDNLRTLDLVFGSVRSAQEGRAIALPP